MSKIKAIPPALAALSGRLTQGSNSLASLNSRFNHSFEVSLDRVTADPEQARRQFDPVELQQLADSLSTVGQLSPVLVRRNTERADHYILVAGERRWRAALLAGWSSLVAIEFNGDAEVAALIENLQRVDLTPLEEARGIERLIRQRGLKQQDVAGLVGKSPGQISSLLKLLTLPETILAHLDTEASAAIPRNTLFEIARAPQDQQAALWALAEKGELNVRTAREFRASEPAKQTLSPASAPRPALRAVEKWTRTLQAVQGAPISNDERQKLQALKRVIDAMLAE